MRPSNPVFLIAAALSFSLSACSINTLALRATADALSSPGSNEVFSGDDDPQLISEALPFAIKLYESLLSQLPGHDGLALTTGSLIVMYANAFVQAPAEMLDDEAYELRRKELSRAKKLYVRGYGTLVSRLGAKHPGIDAALDEAARKAALEKCAESDVPFLYWAGAAAMAAYSLDPLDVGLGTRLGLVRDYMARAYALDPDYGRGAIDDFYVSYYAGLPAGMGGSMEKAEAHLERAIEKSGGLSAGPYVSAALSLGVPRQDYPYFKRMIAAALAIDPDADHEGRLANIIAQRKAEYLIASAEYLFITTEDASDDASDDATEGDIE
ncbi:MAG: TRAP transporter TatT component family protein [Spirochaetes bacterium]|nr:TRAP transporter TatT component family protein [Spirochaetota bacterium]